MLLLIGAWFGTANLRTKQAITFDQRSRSALASNDLAAAFQKEQFAYALAPRAERALTLGSLAYLRADYPAAVRYFRSAAEDNEGGSRNRALVGLAASAAQAGDQATFERAFTQVGRPGSEGLRLALANAAVDAGDLQRAAGLLASDQPNTEELGLAKATSQAIKDPSGALKVLSETSRRQAQSTFDDLAYQRFIEQLIETPEDGRRELIEALTQISQTSAEVSRTVVLAELLYRLGDYRAAEHLAQAAVHTEPDYRDGWNALASAQISLRDYRDAERSLNISTDLDAGYGYTWYLRSKLADSTGKRGQAREYAQRAELLGYEKR